MSKHSEVFIQRLEAGETVIGIAGLGYVGLPLAQHFVKAGLRVVAVDTDPDKIARLRRGESYLLHLSAEWVPDAIEQKIFFPTTDYEGLVGADAVIICVPTPLNPHREPDLRHVESAGREIARILKPGALVSLESTTYPGTTTEVLLPLLSEKGARAGEDFFLAFSPEREDPGNPRFSVSNIPKVIGGVTPECAELARRLYSRIFYKTVVVSCPEAAELCKLLENIFRSVNIALVNELKMLCDRMGLDVWEIIGAAATKPFGYMPFYPGPGLGGHCIPIDPFYLTWKAREYGFTTRFIELSGEINTSMPQYVVSRVMEALNRNGRALKGAKVLVLGVAYKKDVNDIRESPSISLMTLLEKQGALVSYNDPYVPEIRPSQGHGLYKDSVAADAETLAACDVVLVATAHSCYDPEFILEHAPLVVDTRNMTGPALRNREKIFRA
ncbi:MAG TPA: nucleotide sugar dehydrogenase [Candidatus Hydrogenedentes bacterium]|nr:nucleotide sugar dehydrogenase [Candidatus Hydrogenedentota bacterium]